ncbi:NAD(P)-dependent oxidoreductase [Nocardia ignorata]|uniref:NAD(P)-dependent oxidoreductase n=1 Tax=Nocardia ignorata TaxID=145285 RepID=UPI00363F30A0
MTETTTPVTVLGLGLMGRALARAFLSAGHPTTVWNRTPSAAEELVAGGARRVDTVADAVHAGRLIVVCLTDYPAVYAVLEQADLAGTIVVNLTSGDSAQARAAARWTEQRGARYLDGAIMAVPPVIGTTDAVLLHSGAQADFDAAAPVLAALGTVTHLGADHGLAALYDGAGLAMMWSVLNAWLQGTAMLRTAGVDARTFTPFAAQIATGVATWLPGYAEQVDNGAYPAEVAALSTDAASMAHLVEECEALGVNAELPKLLKAMAERAIAAGHGAEQYPALITEFAKP